MTTYFDNRATIRPHQLWLILTLLFSLLTSNVAAQDKPPTWTILIYGHGDHNLAPSLLGDMTEMEAVGSSQNFNIVVEADYDANPNGESYSALLGFFADSRPDNLQGLHRYLMQKNSNPQTGCANATADLSPCIISAPVDTLPEQDLDDPNNLKDFILWGIKKYPADRYGLILWNHGGQWGGFGGDTQDGTTQGRGMKTQPLAQAIASAMQELAVPKLEFISFDTCLMGGAEVLPDFVSLTNVYIANPELDYGAGWDYTASLGYLKVNPSISALDFAKREARDWNAHHTTALDQALAAHVVYNFTRYSTFQTTWYDFIRAITNAYPTEAETIARSRQQTTEYSIENVADLGNRHTDYIDLGHFATLLANNVGANALQTAAQNLVTAINQMVAAKVLGTKREDKALGLSIYYPLQGTPNNGYEDLTFSQQATVANASWSSFLSQVAGSASNNNPPPDLSDSRAVTLQPVAEQPATIEVVIPDNDAVAISANIVRKDLPGNSELLFDEAAGGEVKITIPAVELPNDQGDIDTYTVTLKLVDEENFIFALADYSKRTPEWERTPAKFDLSTGKLHVPIIDVKTTGGEYLGAFMVELQRLPETWQFQLTDIQEAQRYVYLSEVVYQSVNRAGTYPIHWDGRILTLSGDGGNTKAFLSGFFQETDNNIMSSYALYLPPGAAENGQLVILNTDWQTGKVIGALDGEVEDTAPHGIELIAGGQLIPLTYSEIRVGDDPDQWEVELFVSKVFVTIPQAGLSGLQVLNDKVEVGNYTLEVTADDMYGNTSKVQEYPVTIQ
jgi:hypothetical protein